MYIVQSKSIFKGSPNSNMTECAFTTKNTCCCCFSSSMLLCILEFMFVNILPALRHAYECCCWSQTLYEKLYLNIGWISKPGIKLTLPTSDNQNCLGFSNVLIDGRQTNGAQYVHSESRNISTTKLKLHGSLTECRLSPK